MPAATASCTNCTHTFLEHSPVTGLCATCGCEAFTENNPVNHPQHYTQHPSGIECIQITEHMNFCLGNAVKYIWRADLKNGTEDLEKAKWYIEREIRRRNKVDQS